MLKPYPSSIKTVQHKGETDLKTKLKDLLDVRPLREAVILPHEVGQREVPVHAGLFGQKDVVVELEEFSSAKSLKLDTFSTVLLTDFECKGTEGGHHSSVDSSVPTILQSRVQIPRTLSIFLGI